MTFDERLAALGVETSDILPSEEHCSNLYEKFFNSAERICKKMGEKFDLEMLLSYLTIAIARRDIIIDRMETRLNNVIGERDYLRAKYSANPNETVPEDWSADDD